MEYNIYKTGKNKRRAVIIVAVSVLAVIAVGIYIVGLTLGSTSEKRQTVTSAVSENASLRQELSEKEAQIQELQTQINNLQLQLAAVPTQAPAAYTVPPEPTAAAENENVSPREE